MKKLLKKIKKEQRGEMSFGTQILLFLVILFTIWILLSGDQKEVSDTRLFIPVNEKQ